MRKSFCFLAIAIFFICITKSHAAPLFRGLVDDKEKLFAHVLVADDWGTYPVPQELPQDWRFLDNNAPEKLPEDFFDLGQVELKKEGGFTVIHARLSHYFTVYNPSFTREEFKKRVVRLKELKEIKLEIDPSIQKLLEQGPA